MEPRGLNAAVEYGLAFARSRGALEALIVPGDVPLAQPSEFEAILAAAGPGKDRVVLVPCNAGEGTNAMLLAPPDALEPGFGPGSFVCHLAKAAARRLDTQIFHLPGLSADIDAPADVERLAAARERYRSFRPLPLEVRTPHATD
jgi:2-phospho-L-lactate guanylyltransferase